MAAAAPSASVAAAAVPSACVVVALVLSAFAAAFAAAVPAAVAYSDERARRCRHFSSLTGLCAATAPSMPTSCSSP